MRGEASHDAARAGRAVDVGVLLLAWIAAVALVDPRGDFPLNDDWAYGLTVERLVRDGVFQPHPWVLAITLSQTLWGAAATLVAGFSYEVLRASTLLLGGLALAAAYLLARELGASRAAARWAALTPGLAPIGFALSFTFMTDVPFTAFALAALLFAVRVVRRGRHRDLVAATLAMLAAVLCRQIGWFVPIAFAGAHLAAGYGPLRRRLAQVLVLVVVCVAVAWAVDVWLMGAARDVGEVLAVWQRRGTPSVAMRILADNLLAALLYAGLFLAPAVLRFAPGWRAAWRQPRWHDLLVAAIALGLLATLWSWQRTMPLRGNVLITSGLGPVTLQDWYIRGLANDDPLPPAFWLATTGISVAATALLLVQTLTATLGLRRSAGGDPGARGLLLGGAFIYLCGIGLSMLFDRYVIPLAAVLAIAIVPPQRAPAGGAIRFVAGALLLACVAFSITATHDYLSWNRARWLALRQLTDGEHIAAQRIDGGPEFNGPRFYQPGYRPPQGKSWWWVVDDEFIVSMSPLPGYSVRQRYPYRRWLPPGRDEVIVLQRGDGS